jgi:hypothetical protein
MEVTLLLGPDYMCVCACLELNPEPHMLSTGSPTELHHPPPQVLMLFNVLFN